MYAVVINAHDRHVAVAAINRPRAKERRIGPTRPSILGHSWQVGGIPSPRRREFPPSAPCSAPSSWDVARVDQDQALNARKNCHRGDRRSPHANGLIPGKALPSKVSSTDFLAMVDRLSGREKGCQHLTASSSLTWTWDVYPFRRLIMSRSSVVKVFRIHWVLIRSRRG
jgi:hypothetical protein